MPGRWEASSTPGYLNQFWALTILMTGEHCRVRVMRQFESHACMIKSNNFQRESHAG